MKGLVISIVRALLMLGTIVGNALYINKVETKMSRMLNELPEIDAEGCEEAVRELETYWSRNVRFVVLSVNFSTADRVSEEVATLAACARVGDFYGFHSALALLRDAVGDMIRMERFSAAI